MLQLLVDRSTEYDAQESRRVKRWCAYKVSEVNSRSSSFALSAYISVPALYVLILKFGYFLLSNKEDTNTVGVSLKPMHNKIGSL